MSLTEPKQNLILLHGALGAETQFSGLKDLLNVQFNVFTLNLSGHGGSAISGEFTLTQFENDVLEFLDSNNISAAHFFGYSMGGYVAVSLAGKNPSRVLSVFTLATKFIWTPEIAAKEIKMLDPEVIQQKVPKFAEQLQQRHAPADWKINMKVTADFMMWLGNNPPDENFYKKVNCPVCISLGDRDTVAGVAETFSVLKLFPAASMVVIPDAQHPFETIPVNRIVYEIKEFIERKK